MKFKVIITRLACCILFSCGYYCSPAHDIYFCGEKIPLDDKLVSDKLMNIIKRQINYVNIPSIRQNVNQYMSQVESWLRAFYLPQDFKYLAIVESGFKNEAASGAGAVGFWQLMPKTAIQYKLVVNGIVDERTDFDKATYAACKVMADYYYYIKKNFGISSWVLTAAAYNNGIGNIKNAITRQGNNYFSMNLNPETAAYVYKIIAVKELFEYPELYMKNFGYNVFTAASGANSPAKKIETDISGFGTMKVNINEADGLHPDDLKQGFNKNSGNDPVLKTKDVPAKVTGKYKNLKDGDLVSFVLGDNLQVQNRFTSKGITIQGRAWIIDEVVMVDLGYDHYVTLFDKKNNKGIPLRKLKNKQEVVLKVVENEN